MTDAESLSYRIDSSDRITAVNMAWVAFARANGGEHLVPPDIVGCSLWDQVADSSTRLVYRGLLKRVRQGGDPVRFCFRCDSPDQRRLLEMHITSHGDGDVTFDTTLLRCEIRHPVPLLDPLAPRSEGLLKVCGWCMRVPVPSGVWLELEEAVSVLKLFETETLPRLSHGMCPECHKTLIATLETPDGGAEDPVVLGRLPTAGGGW